jgi:hypothetical protein
MIELQQHGVQLVLRDSIVIEMFTSLDLRDHIVHMFQESLSPLPVHCSPQRTQIGNKYLDATARLSEIGSDSAVEEVGPWLQSKLSQACGEVLWWQGKGLSGAS